MKPVYLISRLIRHFLPESVVRFLLRNDIIIHPGLETRFPEQALQHYLEAIQQEGRFITGKRVLIFGYGGRYALGCGLLRAGARHVILCDRFAPPDEKANRNLLSIYPEYLNSEGGQVQVKDQFLSVHQADIVKLANQSLLEPVDVVLSNSVFEHLDQLEAITAALANLTLPQGYQIHFIDLRDHYFKYPFEMLTYSRSTWQNWLNPTSNLNRCRLPEYTRLFTSYFHQVQMTILEHDQLAFDKSCSRIRPEFLTGDSQVDSVTLIRVFAARPKSTQSSQLN